MPPARAATKRGARGERVEHKYVVSPWNESSGDAHDGAPQQMLGHVSDIKPKPKHPKPTRCDRSSGKTRHKDQGEVEVRDVTRIHRR